MNIRYSELCEKDVINVSDGRRVGTVCDLDINCACGSITAIYVSERLFGFASSKGTTCISWEQIACIGEDTVLVNLPSSACATKEDRKCRRFPFCCFGKL